MHKDGKQYTIEDALNLVKEMYPCEEWSIEEVNGMSRIVAANQLSKTQSISMSKEIQKRLMKLLKGKGTVHIVDIKKPE